jgi:hypothetical protein
MGAVTLKILQRSEAARSLVEMTVDNRCAVEDLASVRDKQLELGVERNYS